MHPSGVRRLSVGNPPRTTPNTTRRRLSMRSAGLCGAVRTYQGMGRTRLEPVTSGLSSVGRLLPHTALGRYPAPRAGSGSAATAPCCRLLRSVASIALP